MREHGNLCLLEFIIVQRTALKRTVYNKRLLIYLREVYEGYLIYF